MAVLVELHNTGDAAIGPEVRALIEHALSDRPGDWPVSIVGFRENDNWDMKVLGPNGFERSYTWGGRGRASGISDLERACEVAAGEGWEQR
jgi:hypothetical protein